MRPPRGAAVLSFVLGLVGLAGTTRAQSQPTPSCGWGTEVSGLRVGLCVDKTQFRLDEAVPITVRIENAGPAARVCVGCQLLWSFAVRGPGVSTLGVPADLGLPSPAEFRELGPGQSASFTFVASSSSPFNALVTRLSIPGRYSVWLQYVLDDGVLPGGVAIPGAWAGRARSQELAFEVIAATHDDSRLDRHPGMVALRFLDQTIRPWLLRPPGRLTRAERALRTRAWRSPRRAVATAGAMRGQTVREQYLGPTSCREVLHGGRGRIAPGRTYHVMTIGLGSDHGDHVGFVVVIDDRSRRPVFACRSPRRGPVP